jgi:hypothetical protein
MQPFSPLHAGGESFAVTLLCAFAGMGRATGDMITAVKRSHNQRLRIVFHPSQGHHLFGGCNGRMTASGQQRHFERRLVASGLRR